MVLVGVVVAAVAVVVVVAPVENVNGIGGVVAKTIIAKVVVIVIVIVIYIYKTHIDTSGDSHSTDGCFRSTYYSRSESDGSIDSR